VTGRIWRSAKKQRRKLDEEKMDIVVL
jgi:hypothetical protein